MNRLNILVHKPDRLTIRVKGDPMDYVVCAGCKGFGTVWRWAGGFLYWDGWSVSTQHRCPECNGGRYWLADPERTDPSPANPTEES